MEKSRIYCHCWRSRKEDIGGDSVGSGGGNDAKCTLCGVSFSVRHGGANDVVKHLSMKGHWQTVNSKSSTSTLSRYGFGQSDEAVKARRKDEVQVQRAKALFIQFVAEHNLSFRMGGHFGKLVKSMFPDSEIARQFQCARTKTSVLTRYGNGKLCQDQLFEWLTSDTPIFFGFFVYTIYCIYADDTQSSLLLI